MQIFHFHPLTGFYLGSSNADPDPLELINARKAAHAVLADPARAAFEAAVAELDEAFATARDAAQQTYAEAAMSLDEGDEDFPAQLHALLVQRDETISLAKIAANNAASAAKLNYESALSDADAAAAAVEPEVWLIPGSATEIAPPVASEGEVAVFSEGEWVLVEAPDPIEPE